MLLLSKNLFFVVLIILISLLTLYPSFSLALFGDDWLVIHRYITDVGSLSAGVSRHVREYLYAYGPTQVLMGVLAQFYSFNSTLYFVTSYFLRLFAAFSLFPIVFYLTRNKLSAFFAVLFFSITTTGFDTTNWVFNMTSYLGIGFISLSLYFYLRSKEEDRVIFLVPALILLYFAYITCSIRMHATLPLLMVMESFWNIREKNLLFARKSLIRLGLVVTVLLFIRSTGNSFGQPSEGTARFSEGLNVMISFINQGRYDFLAYPFASFGSVFIPDTILPFTGQALSTTNLVINIIVPILVIFFMLHRLLALLTQDLKKTPFVLYALISVWTIITIIFYRGNISIFSSATYSSLLLIGGYIIILGLIFIAENYKKKSISTLLILSLTWILLSYLYAWWWRPELYLTTNRYLIVGAAAAAIFLSALISLGKNKNNQITIFIIFTPLLFMHIYSTRVYQSQLISFHGQENFNKIWATMPYVPEITAKDKVSVFLFNGDGTNGGILHDSITFGFPYHMALRYNIIDTNKIPLVLESWEEVISMVKDGKAFARHYGIAKDPIPVDNVYVFKFEGKDRLINITTEARKELLKIL